MPKASANDVATRVACGVFEKELNLRKAFQHYDKDGSGFIDKKEFGEVLKGFTTYDCSDDVFDLFDTDKNGVISSEEFQNALLDYGGSAPPPTSSRMRKDMHLEANAPKVSGYQSLHDSGARGGGRSPRKLKQRIAEANTYEECMPDGDALTDAEVMEALTDRLEEEGVPLHTLFRVLCPSTSGQQIGGGSGNRLNLNTGGIMTEEGLRDLVCKMGLAGTLATPEEERAALRTGELQASLRTQRLQGSGHHGVLGSAEGTYKPSAPDGTGKLALTGTVETFGNTLGSGVADAMNRKTGFNNAEQKAHQALQTGDASDDAVKSLLPLIQAKLQQHGYDANNTRDLFLKIDEDRSGKISPKEFFERMSNWGLDLSPEQTLHLLEPFDVDLNGELDFSEFLRWVSMWTPPEGDGEDGQWYRGGEIDKRVWAASGSGSGRVGRSGCVCVCVCVCV
jgi:Ca2+-binding EF-hand superfamily protein